MNEKVTILGTFFNFSIIFNEIFALFSKSFANLLEILAKNWPKFRKIWKYACLVCMSCFASEFIKSLEEKSMEICNFLRKFSKIMREFSIFRSQFK